MAAFQYHSSERTLGPTNGIAALPPRKMNVRLLFDECVFTICDERTLQMNTLGKKPHIPVLAFTRLIHVGQGAKITVCTSAEEMLGLRSL